MSALTPDEQWAIERFQVATRYSGRTAPWEDGRVVSVEEPAWKYLRRYAVAVAVLLVIAGLTLKGPALQALDHVGYSEARL